MFGVLESVMRSATAFLEYGKAPPGTPENLKEAMENQNHLASKKFFVIASSFVILGTFYFLSVGILFLLPRDPVLEGGFVTIFSKVMEVFSIIIATYLGVQAAVDLRYSSSSNASSITEARASSTNIVENVFEYLTNNAKEPDYDIQENNNL
jgi:hypothetical protein